MFTTYILYSELLNRFYTGSTSQSVEQRLYFHLLNHKGFTAQAKDWKVVYTAEFDNVTDSRKLEIKIKKRGAKRFLQSL